LRMLLKTIIPILIVLILTITNPKILSDPPPMLEPEPVAVVAQEEDVKPVRTEIFEITSYSYTGSRTASGTWPKVGTVASDWSVLPPGTKIYVPAIDYYGVVEDTGGAIRGQKLDLYMSSEYECRQFGRQWLEVQILEEGE